MRGLWSPRELGAFQASLLRFLNNHVGMGLVGGVIQETTDIVYKQRVEKIRNLFFVGEIQSPLKRNPGSC